MMFNLCIVIGSDDQHSDHTRHLFVNVLCIHLAYTKWGISYQGTYTLIYTQYVDPPGAPLGHQPHIQKSDNMVHLYREIFNMKLIICTPYHHN